MRQALALCAVSLTPVLTWRCRIDQLLEQVDQGSQVCAVEPILIPEDIAIPLRDSDLTAWVRSRKPMLTSLQSKGICVSDRVLPLGLGSCVLHNQGQAVPCIWLLQLGLLKN